MEGQRMHRTLFLTILPLLALLGCQDYSVGGREPSILVTPDAIDFGYLPNGSSKEESVRISNTGSSVLTIDEISFAEGESQNYSFSEPSRTISPGDFTDMTITFLPSANSFEIEYLNIFSNDPENPVTSIVLVGNVPLPSTYIANENYDNTITIISFLLPNDFLEIKEAGENLGVLYSGLTIGDFNDDKMPDFIGGTVESDTRFFLFTRTNTGSFIQENIEFQDMEGKKIRNSNLFDEDGTLDLLASDLDPAFEGGTGEDYGVYLLKGRGNGDFDPPVKAADLMEICPSDSIIWPNLFSDLTGDKIVDLTYACTDRMDYTDIFLFENNGDGTFNPPSLALSLSLPSSILLPTEVNQDEDNIDDLIVGFSKYGDPGQGYWIKGIGGGLFDPSPRELFDLNTETEEGFSEYGFAVAASYVFLTRQGGGVRDLLLSWYGEDGYTVSFYYFIGDGIYEESPYRAQGLDSGFLGVREVYSPDTQQAE